MPRSVARRRNDPDAAVTEDVVITIEDLNVAVGQIAVQTRIKAGRHHGVSKGAVVLRTLNQQCCPFQFVCHTNVVKMKMRERGKVKTRHRPAHRCDLIREALVKPHSPSSQLDPARAVGV